MLRRALFPALAVLVLVLAAGGVAPRQAFAATLTVASGEVAILENNVCSVREAIVNANNNADTHDDCPASGAYGDDTITLPAGTYDLSPGANSPTSLRRSPSAVTEQRRPSSTPTRTAGTCPWPAPAISRSTVSR